MARFRLQQITTDPPSFLDLLGIRLMKFQVGDTSYSSVFLGSQLNFMLGKLVRFFDVDAQHQANMRTIAATVLPAGMDEFLAILPAEIADAPDNDCGFAVCKLDCQAHAPHGRIIGHTRDGRDLEDVLLPMANLCQAINALYDLSVVKDVLDKHTAARIFLEMARAGVPPDRLTVREINEAMEGTHQYC